MDEKLDHSPQDPILNSSLLGPHTLRAQRWQLSPWTLGHVSVSTDVVGVKGSSALQEGFSSLGEISSKVKACPTLTEIYLFILLAPSAGPEQR